MTTKKDISNKISKELKITNIESESILDSFINLIKKNIKTKNIKISNFGSFYITQTPQRIGRNPKTKKSYIIAARKRVKFRTSSKTKKILN